MAWLTRLRWRFGRGSHIVAHESIMIGDDVWTGPCVYSTDQNHGYADTGIPIGRQSPVNRPVASGRHAGPRRASVPM